MKRDFLIISAVFIFLTFVKFILSFSYSNELWGINIWAFYPLNFRVILIILSIIIFLGIYNERLLKVYDLVLDFFYKNFFTSF